jgi:hypothetical protein
MQVDVEGAILVRKKKREKEGHRVKSATCVDNA